MKSAQVLLVMAQIIKTITASSEFKELERLGVKARQDEAQALYHAEQKGSAHKDAPENSGGI